MRGPRVAVHREMREREPGLSHTSGTQHGRARIVTGNHGRHDRHAPVSRDVARYRLGRSQQARLVRVSIRKPFFLSNTKAEGEHSLVVPALYVLWSFGECLEAYRRTRRESIWRCYVSGGEYRVRVFRYLVASAQSVEVLFENAIYRHIYNLPPSVEHAGSS